MVKHKKILSNKTFWFLLLFFTVFIGLLLTLRGHISVQNNSSSVLPVQDKTKFFVAYSSSDKLAIVLYDLLAQKSIKKRLIDFSDLSRPLILNNSLANQSVWNVSRVWLGKEDYSYILLYFNPGPFVHTEKDFIYPDFEFKLYKTNLNFEDGLHLIYATNEVNDFIFYDQNQALFKEKYDLKSIDLHDGTIKTIAKLSKLRGRDYTTDIGAFAVNNNKASWVQIKVINGDLRQEQLELISLDMVTQKMTAKQIYKGGYLALSGISPNRKLVAVEISFDANSHKPPKILIINLATRATFELPEPRNIRVHWSADSSKFVYESRDQGTLLFALENGAWSNSHLPIFPELWDNGRYLIGQRDSQLAVYDFVTQKVEKLNLDYKTNNANLYNLHWAIDK